jgi:hypothetical protein
LESNYDVSSASGLGTDFGDEGDPSPDVFRVPEAVKGKVKLEPQGKKKNKDQCDDAAETPLERANKNVGEFLRLFSFAV